MEPYYDPDDKPMRLSDKEQIAISFFFLVILFCIIIGAVHAASWIYNLLF